MKKLNLPKYTFRTRQNGTNSDIFDAIRRKFVRLTPEEWVRQNFIQYLITEKHMPPSLIYVEKLLKYNTMTKKADIVIYDSFGSARIIVECKAPHIPISQDTFAQVAVYNFNLHVDYLIVTNGLLHICCLMDYNNSTFKFVDILPDYMDLQI